MRHYLLVSYYALKLAILIEPVMKCNRKGCETQWVSTKLDSEFFIVLNNLFQLCKYHVECIGVDQMPRKWICTACEVSGEGQVAKRLRK